MDLTVLSITIRNLNPKSRERLVAEQLKKNRQRADQIEKEIEELEKKKREEIARIDAEIAKKQNIIKTISK